MTHSEGTACWGSVRTPGDRRWSYGREDFYSKHSCEGSVPWDTRKPGGTTLGQRPRHPSGSPLRNWDSIRGATARSLRSPREGKSERVAQHCVRPSIVTGRDAGGGPVERRAGRRAPHCRKGRARQQRSRPDRAHLQVVLR